MTLRRKPSASRRSTGTSKVVRRLPKYSSSWWATASRRAGARRTRGLTRPGKSGQHRVVVLDVVGDADQADGGRGQQQGADGTVDGSVGDVEQTVGGGDALEPVMQPGQRLVVGLQFVEKVGTHAVSSSG